MKLRRLLEIFGFWKGVIVIFGERRTLRMSEVIMVSDG